MAKQRRHPDELRERAVRMVREHRGEYPSGWQACQSIAPKVGVHPVTLQVKRRAAASVRPPQAETPIHASSDASARFTVRAPGEAGAGRAERAG